MAKRKPAEPWTERRIYSLLSKPFPSPAWVLLPQVRNGTGFKRKKVRTADAVAVSVYPSRGLYLAGIEIKVTLADWRKELAEPDKAEMQKWCQHWYIAAPKGLIPHGELPETWGLVECSPTSAKVTVKAPKLDPEPPDMLLLCSILRKAAELKTAEVNAEIEDLVTEKVNSRMKYERKTHEQRVQQLTDLIESFQKASGVNISNRWLAGDIGEAVKMVVAGKHLDVDNRIKALKKQAERIVASCDEALEAGVK